MKEIYQRMNERIHPAPTLIEATLRAANAPQKTPKAGMPRGLRFIPALALILALLVATPALAASNEEFNALLYRIAPDIAMHFRPVNRSCTSSGVTIEVLAVDVDGPVAEMYVAVSGEGVDRTIDFYDSYRLDRPSDTKAGCILASYDETSQTAVFRILYELLDGSDIAATDKVTFSVSQLLRSKTLTLKPLNDFALPLGEAETYQLPDESIMGYGGAGDDWIPDGTVMAPGQAAYEAVPGLPITAAGMVNGQYRIQLLREDIINTDNHGFLTFRDEKGNVVYETHHSFDFVEHPDGKRMQYEEFIFDANAEELSRYTLWIDAVTAEPAISGDWTITFPLENYAK